jgi:hypothetical protein
MDAEGACSTFLSAMPGSVRSVSYTIQRARVDARWRHIIRGVSPIQKLNVAAATIRLSARYDSDHAVP